MFEKAESLIEIMQECLLKSHVPYSMMVLGEKKGGDRNRIDYMMEVAVEKAKQLKIDTKSVLKQSIDKICKDTSC